MSIKRKIVNILDSNAFFIVFGLSGVFILIYMDLNRNVKVTMCENKGVTTYIGKMKPPTKLKLGECNEVIITNSEYYELRTVIKHKSNL
tara:strand:+ start:993 stop:1259 length:267 start_codon:yes stop_codon:yes gene_type:complete